MKSSRETHQSGIGFIHWRTANTWESTKSSDVLLISVWRNRLSGMASQASVSEDLLGGCTGLWVRPEGNQWQVMLDFG